MNRPNEDLLRAYGTEGIFREKTAGVGPLAARLAYGALQYGSARREQGAAHEQRLQAQFMNEALRELEAMQMAQANQGLRHTHVPVFVAPMMPHGRGVGGMGLDSDIPVGMDEGMVRLGSVAALAGVELAQLRKEAGIGDLLAGAAKGLGGLGKGVAKGVGGLAANTARGVASLPGRAAGAIASGAKATGGGIAAGAGRIGQSMTGLGQKLQTGLTNAGQSAQTSLAGAGARAQSALSGKPNVQALMSSGPKLPAGALAPPSPSSFAPPPAPKASAPQLGAPGAPAKPPTSAGPTPVPAAAPAAKNPPYRQPAQPGMAPSPPAPQVAAQQPALRAPTQPAAASATVPPPQPAAPGAPAAPAAGGTQPPGTLDRLKSELGGGQWKSKAMMLGAAGLGTYGAVKGLKAGLNYLSNESTPYSFNQGGPQLAHGVNQYGYPQLGTP